MFARAVPESATPGVGLGLAICRAILDAHGGTISASNRPEGGACVTFTVPMGTPPVIEEEVDDGNGKGRP
jgi:two-component system sensor histidine kinase KdpD